MSILIQNTLAYLGEPLEAKRCDILIDASGTIAHIGEAFEITQAVAKVIDGSDYITTPSLTDLHVHFREPGFEHKETLKTGTMAAIKGGVTTVCTMPNTQPPIDRPERLIAYMEKIQSLSGIQILPSVAITINQAGQEITPLAEMAKLGAVAYTDDGRTVMSESILEESLKISQKTNRVVMTHSEDHQLAVRYPDGPYPPEVESDIVKRDIKLLEDMGQGHLHIAHLSTEGALEAVQQGKAKGLKLTCEIAPHHLFFDADTLNFETATYKVNPPLRGERNRQALIAGVKSGLVDAIASDHAPHEAASKSAPYAKGTYGFTGLETLFAASYTILKEANVPFETILKMMTKQPRAILGLPFNQIEVGQLADIVLIDLNQEWIVEPNELVSKSKNTPWAGLPLTGKVTHVIRGNRLLLEKGELKWPLNN